MEWLKTLHIVAACLWIGNFVVTGVWSLRAFRSDSIALQAFAAREILFTDMIFTLGFGTAVVTSGLGLAGVERIAPWTTAWTRDALIVVIASGIVWLAILLPLELRMKRELAAGRSAGRAFTLWNVLGWLVTVALVAVVYLMVRKPA